MKRIGGWVLAGMGVMLACTMADSGLAQGVRGAPGVASVPEGKRMLLIRHMPKLNRVKQPTPNYGSSATRTRPREWGVFEIAYDTVPEWMDEVDVTYYLMTERRTPDTKKEYSFYQTTVRYADVARGEHLACVVLPPVALLRYGDQVIGFAAEFSSADGTLLAVNSVGEGTTQLPPEWWKKTDVTESKSVVKRNGLVDRSKTPFGLVNIDDYEVVK
jgi:hypothetical protein